MKSKTIANPAVQTGMTFMFLSCALLMMMILFTGCGDSGPPSVGDDNQSNLQRLANLYNFHQLKNQGAGPADEAAFKTFIQSVDEGKLAEMGITDVDSVFVSERDSQPFTVRYSVQAGARGSVDAVIFEQTGVAGKRMVGFTSMVQKEVDGAEYERLLAENDDGVANR